ncbi:MAG: hypothetical protein DI570_01285 [Phenylobacterium zucineum]|nr:MAG: hypothetical protein DI570_01285 [Phenylobacterium zucineum]
MTALRSVLIRGDGIAAACCAHLLRKAGLDVRITAEARPTVPALLVSEPALALMRDVFELPGLLADQPRVRRRVVAWGEAAPASLPHGGIAVAEAGLLDSLRTADADAVTEAEAADFVIHAAGAPPEGSVQRRFGARLATSARVRLLDPADIDACWIESAAEGWLFLVPGVDGDAWLLAVGGSCEALLARSRLIGPRVALVEAGARGFDCSPRLATPSCGDDWLVCGATATGFDPICGDGTAQAVRTAILASAVVTGIAEGGDRTALLKHYDLALTASVRRHLMLCGDFYRTGGDGPWWQGALDELHAGHRWCTSRLAHAGDPAYELQGFRLKARDFAT